MTWKSETQIKNENVILCMHAFTILMILPGVCTSLILSRTRALRPSNLLAWLLCPLLRQLSQPILSLGLAVFCLAWTSLPDQPNAQLNLPTHSEFMQNLKILPCQDDELEECMICWNNSHPLALLPCSHRGCTQCLQLMAPLQTACPMCRKPLFNGHDWLVLTLSKAGNSMTAVVIVLGLFEAAHRVYTSQYVLATFSALLLGWYGYIAWNAVHAIRHIGADWWRLPPGRGGFKDVYWGLGSCGLSFCLTWYNLTRALE